MLPFARTSRLVTVLLPLILAAGMTAALGRDRPKVPALEVAVTQQPERAEPGGRALVELALTPPDGVLLNRYPGIRLRLERSAGLSVPDDEVFVGSRTPIESPDDPDAAYFDTPVPIRVELVAERTGPATRRLNGSVRFFYCVKKSGFCAPARQKVSLPVVIARD